MVNDMFRKAEAWRDRVLRAEKRVERYRGALEALCADLRNQTCAPAGLLAESLFDAERLLSERSVEIEDALSDRDCP